MASLVDLWTSRAYHLSFLSITLHQLALYIGTLLNCGKLSIHIPPSLPFHIACCVIPGAPDTHTFLTLISDLAFRLRLATLVASK